MVKFQAESSAELSHLYTLLTVQEEENDFQTLVLRINNAREFEKCKSMLERVLTHVHCKVSRIELEETVPNALDTSDALQELRKWCELGNIRRNVQFRYFVGNLQYELWCSLREAYGNTNMRRMCLSGGMSTCLPICKVLLRPLLANPRNTLSELELREIYISNDEAKELGHGLMSKNCRLKQIRMVFNTVHMAAFHSIFESLRGMSGLEELIWVGEKHALQDIGPGVFMARICRLLESPGNQLRLLSLTASWWSVDHISMLVKSLSNVHCKLRRFSNGNHYAEGVVLPLLQSLRNPKTPLTSLEIDFFGEATVILQEGLMDVNCKLESLVIRRGGTGNEIPIAVANALERANSSRLRTFEMYGMHPQTIFRSFTQSLRSPANKLRKLFLSPDPSALQYIKVRDQFFRALRRSNVVDYHWQHPEPPFINALKSPWFEVLHALLSIKHFPRLGLSSYARLLPFQDLILSIAHTLGWRLGDLWLDAV